MLRQIDKPANAACNRYLGMSADKHELVDVGCRLLVQIVVQRWLSAKGIYERIRFKSSIF